jgi:MFS family permease
VLAGGVIASFGPLLADWSKGMFAPIDFAGVYVAVGAIYVATLFVLRFITIPPPNEEERARGGRPILQIMRQPTFIVAALGSLIGYTMMSLLMTATPLAMRACGLGFTESAQAIQWHVLGMFAPSFFTGHLIRRFGTLPMMGVGAFLIGVCIICNLQGITLVNFWIGAILLGVGWNFLFIGGTTLVTELYTPAEKAKTQAAHDFIVFGGVACAALLSGVAHEEFGWQTMNHAVIPFLIIVLFGLAWLGRHRRTPIAAPAE